MVKEAEANAEADKKRREVVEARNQTEALMHQVEKNLSEHGDKLAAADKGEAEAALAAAKSALEGEDADALKKAGERLSQAAMKIGEQMYKAEAAANAGGPGPGGDATGGGASAAADEKVVDAEFEEVDDKKKRSA
jgi:molecular chaperone DnaK